MLKLIQVLLCFVLINTLRAQPLFVKDSLKSFIQEGMKKWQIPGLALVVVKDGKVVTKEGYGIRNLETREKVDAHTLFYIASNTKLFTGTALANLAYEKKLSLNDKITQFYPWFQLYDKTSTSLVTIKDMLTHRIGTKTFQGDLTFWNSRLHREDIMKKMSLLKPSQGFRESYGYCNSCYLVAGMVIPKAVGQTWEQYIEEKLLLPLGMDESKTVSNGYWKTAKNMAAPYTTAYTDTLRRVPYDQWDNLGPAASILSNVDDLSHWLMFQLDSGKYENRQILPWSVIQQTRDVQIVTGSRKSAALPVHFRGYGLGLSAADYNGYQVYWHTGGAAGMVSNVCFVPELDLGIAVLTNNDNQNFFEALRYQLLDAYTGVKTYVNRSEQFWPGQEEGMKTQLAEIAAYNSRVKNYREEPIDLKKYNGKYKNDLYGNIVISASNSGLLIKFGQHPDLEGRLEYMGNEEWLLSYNNIEYGIYSTRFDIKNGKPKSLRIKVNDFIEYDEYIFVKD
ncbi:MAG: serine hydrolase [Saprospiraceae bacterium]|jgi:CubicO group peptidase (beta-lactamase class C family)|nr:serine hydrolase [Saprospiraceae bacterium]MBP9194369.1 serine hydrolase [Saprospiraceae bacterium]